MGNISDFLGKILSARYGKDVRQSIHDTIQQCYYDGKAGSIDIEARESIETIGNNKLDKKGDSASNTVTFTSGDSTSPTGWADIVAVASGETHASLFRKFSLTVKNLRYLYKMLGNTDISAIGDGTITGAISTQNSNFTATNVDNATFRYNSNNGKFELLYKCGNTYSLVGWNDNSFSYDYFNGTEWVRKWDLNSNLKNMEWKLITSASPASENYQLAIPLDIAEICVVIRPNGNSYNEMIVSIPTTILSEEYRNIGVTRTRYENTDEKCFATLGLLRGSSDFVVNMESCNIGANDVRINSYIWVYGKK